MDRDKRKEERLRLLVSERFQQHIERTGQDQNYTVIKMQVVPPVTLPRS